jgi:hypothetical protein
MRPVPAASGEWGHAWRASIATDVAPNFARVSKRPSETAARKEDVGGGPSRRSSRFLLLAGTLNVIDGVGAVSNAQFLAQGHDRARTAAAQWRVPSARTSAPASGSNTFRVFQGSASSIGDLTAAPGGRPKQKRLAASIGANHPGDPTPTPPKPLSRCVIVGARMSPTLHRYDRDLIGAEMGQRRACRPRHTNGRPVYEFHG